MEQRDAKPNGPSDLMRKILVTAALGLIVFTAESANAQNAFAINTVLPGCRLFTSGKTANDGTEMLSGVCVGIVGAALAYSQILDPKNRFCQPNTITLLQAVEVVTRGMNSRPELWHEDFRSVKRAFLGCQNT